MINIVKDKSFYKGMFVIALPIAMQNVIDFAVGFFDTIMVGALGENELAGVHLADRLTFIIGVTSFGISSAAIVLASQYWGKKDVVSIRKIMAIAIRFSMVVSIIGFVIALFFPTQYMMIFTKDAAIISEGVVYLKYISFAYLFKSITSVYLTTIRSVEQVKISTIIYGFSCVFDFILNYIFIFGKLGVPKMGTMGASFSTTITRICEFIILLYYMYFKEDKVHFKMGDLLKFDKTLTSDFIKTGAPVILNEVAWAVGVSLQSIIIGRMGSSVVSANTILGTVSQLAHVFIFGVANAAAVIIGKIVGAGEDNNIKKYSNTFHLMGIITGIMGAIIVLLTRGFVINFYNVSALTKDLAYNMMFSLSILIIFMAISSINLVGTLRGGGDVKFGMYADLILVWLVSFPLGLLSAFVWHLPIPIVYMFLKIDEVIKTILCLWRTRNDNWVKDVTREFNGIDIVH